MKIRLCLIFAMIALLVSCDNVPKEERTYTEIDAPAEIAERAYKFAELYKQTDTEYHLGGQDPVRAIQIDCSGLIIMCYKYALVDTKYQLLVLDMAVAYIYDHASTHIEKSELKKGNLLFMGPTKEDDENANENEISHISLFEKLENGRIYFIDSTQKDTNGDGVNDIDGVIYRDYPEDDSRFKAFGRMRVKC